jgi:hypothetical protein
VNSNTSVKRALRGAAAILAVGSMVVTGAAWGNDAIQLDGDTASTNPQLSYGSGSGDRACDTRGLPVNGVITVNYNGSGSSGHFQAGEPLTVSFGAPAGVTSATTAVAPTVPTNWDSNDDTFTIPFTTTVDPASAGGAVEVTVRGDASGYDAGAAAGSGRPKFQVQVDCSTTIDPGTRDTTAPIVTLAHIVDGNNGWNKTAPVTVAVTATDDKAVTGIVCTDSLDGGTPASIPVTNGALSVTCDGIHELGCVASDAAGNHSATGTDRVKLDTVAPATTFTGTTPDKSDGTDAAGDDWFNQAVVLHWSCADATSGPVSATTQDDLTGEGRDQSATGRCEDMAGNTSEDTQDGVNIDLTAPALNITGADSGSYDVCSVPARPTSSPTDALSGLNPVTAGDSWTTPAQLGLGTSTYEAHADDYATNHSSETRRYVADKYGSAFSGVLQPINTDGSSRFKLGSTIPVKFTLTCKGTPVTNAVASLRLTQGDSAPDAGVDEAISTAASTTGNLFRYDATAGQYIFNLSTKLGYTNPNGTSLKFAQGTWTLSVVLGDGSVNNVKIQLVK